MPYGRQHPFTPPHLDKIRREQQEAMHLLHKFMRVPPETKVDAHQVKTILRHLSKNLNLHSFHKREVLDCIANRMYRSDFADSRCVFHLLNAHHFSFRSLVVRGANAAIPSEEHHEFVTYFLEHAYRRRMLFNGHRLPCVEVFYGGSKIHPIQYAVYTQNVPLLSVFLRYGALLSYGLRRWRTERPGRTGWWFVVLLRTWILPAILDLNPDMLRLEELDLSPENHEQYWVFLKCFALFLPDFPRLSPSLLRSVYYRGRYFLREEEEVKVFVRDFSARVMPGFDQLFNVPLNLKAACRKVIRWRLNKKWLLPGGINRLPLPKVLKQYIDLDIL